MKLSHAIHNVDRSDDNYARVSEQFYTDMGFPGGEYNDNSDKVEERIKSYWLLRRNCTDTWVGARVYYYDDQPFAVSIQSARKNGEDFKFVSRELFLTVHEMMSKLLVTEPPQSDILNLDEEIGETYQIEYTNGAIDDDVIYMDEPAAILRKETREARDKLKGIDWHINKRAVIRTASGEVKEVDMSDLHFPYRVAN